MEDRGWLIKRVTNLGGRNYQEKGRKNGVERKFWREEGELKSFVKERPKEG
jgi:hypothetical protein